MLQRLLITYLYQLQILERVAACTRVSLNSVRRIKKEAQEISNGQATVFSTPNKVRNERKTKTRLDDFDRDLLRRTIISYHATEKAVPTLNKIHNKFKEINNYQGSKESLRKEMQTMGFRWKKMDNNRKILMERPEIRRQRINFLRKIRNYRQEGQPIIYMDETYIHASHTFPKGWSDNSNSGLKQPISKGARLIIVNAGGEDGFVPNTYIRWKSTHSTGDYHNEMNFENYQKWIKEKLLPNLQPKSVVIIDNAPYHNKQVNKCPTSASTKAVMQAWLRQHDIPYAEGALKPELYGLIQTVKPKFKSYVIDQLFTDYGHNVLRLPPYHPNLNPIEMVWAQMKQYVAERNVNFSFESVLKTCDDFFMQFKVD